MAVTDYYLFVYKDFIKNQLVYLVTKYSYLYKIPGYDRFALQDEVQGDVGLTFCCKCQDVNQFRGNFIPYLQSSLKLQVKYSLLRQLRESRNRKREITYYQNKFGLPFQNTLIDRRTNDPAAELFRLQFTDFDFSPLNQQELYIIGLFFGRDKKIREIANILHIPENTVRQYKKRALAKLAQPNEHLWLT